MSFNLQIGKMKKTLFIDSKPKESNNLNTFLIFYLRPNLDYPDLKYPDFFLYSQFYDEYLLVIINHIRFKTTVLKCSQKRVCCAFKEQEQRSHTS